MDIGSQGINDCYFLKTGKEFPRSLDRKLVEAISRYNKRNKAIQLIFTYDRESTINERFSTSIKRANHNILMVAYELDHKRIIDLLMRKAGEFRGGIYLITNLDKEIREYLLEEESPRREFLEEIRTSLARGGVYQRGLGAHAKLAIIDGKVMFITSANITRKALGDVEDKEGNFEIGFEVNSDKILEIARKFFAYLWFAARSEIVPSAKDAIIATRQRSKILLKIRDELERNIKRVLHDFWKGKTNIAFVYLAPKKPYLYDTLKEMIGKARREILISSYNFVDPQKDLVDAIGDALRRNVRIKILLKPMNFRSDQRKSLYNFLQDLGSLRKNVWIGGLPINHAKYVVVDREVVLVSSMNIDGRHLEDGYEVGLLVRDPELGKLLGAITDYLFENVSHVASYRPTLLDLAYRTDNNPIIVRRVVVKVRGGVSLSERDLRSKLVAVYEDRDKQGYVLRVGDDYYEINMNLNEEDSILEISILGKLKSRQEFRFRGYLIAKKLSYLRESQIKK